MNKLASIVVSIAFFAACAVPAAAMSLPTVPGGGGNPGCQINCDGGGGEIAEPGDPFIPPEGCMYNCDGPGDTADEDCMYNCDGPGDTANEDCMINCGGGDLPDPDKPGAGKPQQQASADQCGEKLGYLRDVTASQIESVGSDDIVDIIPVCRAKPLATEQEDVAELRPAIAANLVLDQELNSEGFNPEDVVGVIVDGRKVVLYVHQL